MYVALNKTRPTPRAATRARRTASLRGMRGGYYLGDECIVDATGARVCYAPNAPNGTPGSSATQTVCTPAASGPRYLPALYDVKLAQFDHVRNYVFQYHAGDLDVYSTGGNNRANGQDYSWMVAAADGSFYPGHPAQKEPDPVCVQVAGSVPAGAVINPVSLTAPTYSLVPSSPNAAGYVAAPAPTAIPDSQNLGTALSNLPTWAKFGAALGAGFLIWEVVH